MNGCVCRAQGAVFGQAELRSDLGLGGMVSGLEGTKLWCTNPI